MASGAVRNVLALVCIVVISALILAMTVQEGVKRLLQHGCKLAPYYYFLSDVCKTDVIFDPEYWLYEYPMDSKLSIHVWPIGHSLTVLCRYPIASLQIMLK